MNSTTPQYDSLLFVSFGGPNHPDQVMPFLENVVRGRNVPRERLLEVAEHYQHFGGKSPINQQNLELIEGIQHELQQRKIPLAVYFGNRNWNPFISEALQKMKSDGKKRALAFFTSMFSCYSGCRQYRENIAAAQSEVIEAPTVEKLRFGFNHPGFIEAMKDRVSAALSNLPDSEQENARFIFTAHSIPMAMSEGSSYVTQLKESARLIASRDDFVLCFQSRSGPGHIPWLEPDILDVLDDEKKHGTSAVVVIPLGFVSDHMEVLFDLDEEAKQKAESLGLHFSRAKTVGTHPAFIQMIVDLIEERMGTRPLKAAIGELPAWHDVCPATCCPSGRP